LSTALAGRVRCRGELKICGVRRSWPPRLSVRSRHRGEDALLQGAAAHPAGAANLRFASHLTEPAAIAGWDLAGTPGQPVLRRAAATVVASGTWPAVSCVAGPPGACTPATDRCRPAVRVGQLLATGAGRDLLSGHPAVRSRCAALGRLCGVRRPAPSMSIRGVAGVHPISFQPLRG